MTTAPTIPLAEATPDELAGEAAAAAAAVLPSQTPLNASSPQPGFEQLLPMFAVGVVASLTGRPESIGMLVAADLVEALASSPSPGLDLAAAVQPALDAAASALGYAAEPAREMACDLVPETMGGDVVAVPLIGTGFAACVLIGAGALTPVVPPPTNRNAFAPDPSLPIPPPGAGPATMEPSGPRRGIEMLHGVDMELTVELGRTRLTVRELLALSPGDVLELDRAAGSPADLLVNGRLIARGEVVVVDEDFGLRVTEIVASAAI
ncbi:MAG: flagellar motor switch protein FliN [Actinomycetota bacterium]|nr:flagellar motor switch protein FliN [Actinomycetota bacterium]